MAKTFNFLDPKLKKMSFTKTSPAVEATVYDSYPEAQCRIESLKAGNFCTPKNSPTGFPCKGIDNSRPRCWFIK